MRFFSGSFSKKRVILFSILAAVLGLGSFMTLSVASSVLLMPILLCLLYAGGGPLPLLVGSILCCATFASLAGSAGALLAFLALVFPALAVAAAMLGGTRYAVQLKISVAAHVGGMLLMLVLASVMTGGQLIEALVEALRQSIDIMPKSFQDTLLIMLYPELSPSGAMISLSSAVRTQYLNDLFRQMNGELSLQTLPMLLQSSLLSAGLASYLPARALRKRDQLAEEAFRPISEWFMPGQLCVGILLTTLASYLLTLTGTAGADTAFIAMSGILRTVFAAQGVAAMDRMLCASRASTARKVLMIGAVYLLAPSLVTVAGLCSALFGRKGLIHQMKNKNLGDD